MARGLRIGSSIGFLLIRRASEGEETDPCNTDGLGEALAAVRNRNAAEIKYSTQNDREDVSEPWTGGYHG